ncbi:suppressor of forked protein SUF [Toxoplasma gondii CAST]|uniref:Suppressor of forked protein SUF n=1 Tax=Toxoplasma gondii CAST TaxID=943122 RepID=A0A3R8AIB1_TOXGO|nr:suppressor of forked protein SUF [Toxoplasma gondii CAST]
MNESSALYERVLASFPTSVKYWKRYAEFCYRTGKVQAASAVYRRCIYACPHLDLWLSYLRFLYRVGSLHDFVQNLRRATDKVGYSYRSAPLWMELLALYIRVHNTLLLLKGNTQGLLSAPNLPGCSPAGLSPTPLLASEEEQRSFCRPLSATVGPLSEKLADVNVLRTAFQQCLSTAIDGLDGVWAAYCSFESSVGASNSQLASKLTGEMEPHFEASKHAYQEILRLTRRIDPLMLAVPLHEAVKSQEIQLQLEAWRALLRYEKKNPLRLHASSLLRRLTHLFQGCLLSCAFVSDFWIDFFQLLLAHNHPQKAVAVLRRAIEQFLPDDELLQLVLADFLESRRLVNAADAVYRSALAVQAQLHTTSLSPVGDSAPEGAIPGGRSGGPASAVMLIRFLDFIRRTHGETAWRTSFYEIAKFPQGCPWEVCLAYAQAEWCIYRSEANALRALRIAYQRYRLHVHFLLAYVDFLVNIGRLDAARELLRISVCALQREQGTGSALLWRKWIRLELRYGDAASLQGVIYLRAQQRAQLPLDDASLLQSAAELEGGPLDSSGASALTDAEGRHRAETAVLCNRNSVAHAEGKDKATDGATVEKDDLARAKLAVRKRQFMGGDGLNEIADCYHLLGRLAPRSSLLRSFFADAEEAEQTAEDAFDEDMEREEDGEEGEFHREAERGRSGGRRRGPRLGKHRKGEGGDRDSRATAAGVCTEQEPQGKVEAEARMGEIAAAVASTAVATGAGYTSKQLSETAKRKFPETAAMVAPDKEDAEASAGPPVDPPKAICDLLALLPKNDMRNFVDADLVEYTMMALAGLELPEVPESERVPIPVKDLLALRHSQLQCFRAMQIQQHALAASPQRQKVPGGSGSGAEAASAGPAADEEQDAESRSGPSPSPFPDRRSSSQPRSFFGHRRRGEASRDGRGRPRASEVLSSALSDISSGDDEAPIPPDLEFFASAPGELGEPGYLHPHLHAPGEAAAGGPAPWPATLAHAAPPPRAGGIRQPHAVGARALAAGAYPVPQQLVYPGQEFVVAPGGAIHARSALGREAFVPGAVGPPLFPSAAGGVPTAWVFPGGPPPASLDPHLAGIMPGAVPYGHVYPQMHPLPTPMAATLGAPRHDVPLGWHAAPGFLGGLFGGGPLPKATRRRLEAE